MKLSSIRFVLAVILVSTSLQCLAETANKDRIDGMLETLRTAINAHDYAQLKPLLDDDFNYGGRNSTMSTMIMRKVISDYPQEVSAITVISISPLEEGWDVAVRLEGKEPSKQRVVTLTKNYLIKQADIADIQVMGHG